MSLRRLGLLSFVALLGACSGKEFTGLKPKLEVRNGVTNPNTQHYLIDFGKVSLGATGHRNFTVANIGRAPMSVPPIADLAAPFAQNAKTAIQVDVQGVVLLTYSFTPTQAGPFQQSVALNTTGGTARIDFLGEGVDGPPPTCDFALDPEALDFGNVLPGQTSTLGVRFLNNGETDCELSSIQLDPSSNPAFTLPAGQPTEQVVMAGAGAYRLGVIFAPTQAGDSFTGKLTFTVGPQGTAVEVPLSGMSHEHDCAFTVSPNSLTFGNVASGQSKTMSVTVTQTGSTACEVSDVGITTGSNAAFALASGQVTSSMLTTSGSTFAIRVTFSPTQNGSSFTGKLAFVMGPQGTTQEVPLNGSSTTATCSFRISPTALAFGAVVAGHSKTLTATVTRSGSTTCNISGVQLDPSSNPAFSLAAGQATSGSLPTALSSFPIKVKFSPAMTSTANFIGRVTLQIGPPGTNAAISLTGSSPPPCSNPNPDGTCPAATGSVYLNTSSDLYRFDPTTHQAVHMGAFNGSAGTFNMYDIAIDPQGQLLGVSSGTLYVIDPVTALCTEVGSVDNSANGLTFLPDGRLVAAGGDSVEIIDPSTYAVQRNLVSGSSYTSSGDIIALPDGMLYWTVQGGDDLIRIDPSTGATTRLGSIGQSAVYGLGYANGVLFGFNNGHYMVINQSNASAMVGNVSGAWYGATTNPMVW